MPHSYALQHAKNSLRQIRRSGSGAEFPTLVTGKAQGTHEERATPDKGVAVSELLCEMANVWGRESSSRAHKNGTGR